MYTFFKRCVQASVGIVIILLHDGFSQSSRWIGQDDLDISDTLGLYGGSVDCEFGNGIEEDA